MSTLERRRGRTIGVAAVLVIATAIALLQLQRQDQAGPPAGPDDPPSGIQLIYLRDPGRSHWIVAYDWSGKRRGSLRIPTWVDPSKLRPAPDGSGFMLDPVPGDYAAYFDRLGHTRVESRDASFVSQVWSADGGKICVLEATDSGIGVVIRSPANQRHVATIVPAPEVLVGPEAILACSVRSDVAIVQVETRVLRVRLSTGSVLGAADLAADTIVASADGSYVAAGSSFSQEAGRVYRSTDLSTPQAFLGRSIVPLAFSGDDSTLLTTSPTDLEVTDWASARVTWSQSLGSQTGPWLARPAGRLFAIGLSPDGGAVIAGRNGVVTSLPAGRPIGW